MKMKNLDNNEEMQEICGEKKRRHHSSAEPAASTSTPLHQPSSKATPIPARLQELTTIPDQVSCFVPGLRWVMVTSTACFFSYLGGIEQIL